MELCRHRIWKLRLFSAALLLLISFSLSSRADELICAICGKPLQDRYHYSSRIDLMDYKRKIICKDCQKIQDRCYLCGLPVLDGFKRLPDGRIICAKDLKTVVQSESEAMDICGNVPYGVDRLLSRFLTLPEKNVHLTIEDKYHLEDLMRSSESENSCASLNGVTSSHPLPGHSFIHDVRILSCQPRARLMAVCAHEYTHTWLNENVSQARRIRLDKNIVEGFCELVAYKFMDSLHEDAEMQCIQSNDYTKGKVLVLIDADKKYGFATVMDWMKDGEDQSLFSGSLDRIRQMRDQRVISYSGDGGGLIYGTAAVRTPVPDTLELKGISGAGQHRFALINNATFEASEKGKVRVGQKALNVTCLEIGKDYVTIQVEGSPEKTRLSLRSKQ